MGHREEGRGPGTLTMGHREGVRGRDSKKGS